jgi:hypothetical protein
LNFTGYCGAAFTAELRSMRIIGAALQTASQKSYSTIRAEFPAVRILALAVRAAHSPSLGADARLLLDLHKRSAVGCVQLKVCSTGRTWSGRERAEHHDQMRGG